MQLHSVPIRNEAVQTIESSESRMIVGVALKYEGLMRPFAKLLSMKSMKKYQLEGLSLELYRGLDGRKTVEDIVDEMMKRFSLSFFEARALTMQYLEMLMRRGLAVVAVKDD